MPRGGHPCPSGPGRFRAKVGVEELDWEGGGVVREGNAITWDVLDAAGQYCVCSDVEDECKEPRELSIVPWC